MNYKLDAIDYSKKTKDEIVSESSHLINTADAEMTNENINVNRTE